MKLTTQKLKQLIREELAKINEAFGPEGNLSVNDIIAAFKEIADERGHKSGWMYQLMNVHDGNEYAQWAEALKGDGKLPYSLYPKKHDKFDPENQIEARVIHEDAVELATERNNQKFGKQKELPMSENRRR